MTEATAAAAAATEKAKSGLEADLAAAKIANEAAEAATATVAKATNDVATAAAELVVVNAKLNEVNALKPDTYDFSSVIGGVDPATSKYTGLKLLMNVDKEPVGKDPNGNDILLSSVPKILIAPELSANTGVAETLSRAASAIRGFCFVDCPNESLQGAIDFAATFTSSFGTPCYPAIDLGGKVGEVGLSAAAAGVMSRTTRDDGYWISPSNRVINSVVRLSKPIGWSLSDAASDANTLNQNGVMTVIRQDGFRLWGNLTRASQEDIRFKFISVRRIANELNDSAVKNHFWAIDQNITKSYISTVTGGLNQKMRDMTALGALLGGRAFVSAEENTIGTIKLGNIKFSFEYTPVYPANEIEFESIMTDIYLKELLA